MHPQITHLNPPGLHKNPAFTQAVAVSGPGTTIYVGGQRAVERCGGSVMALRLERQYRRG